MVVGGLWEVKMMSYINEESENCCITHSIQTRVTFAHKHKVDLKYKEKSSTLMICSTTVNQKICSKWMLIIKIKKEIKTLWTNILSLLVVAMRHKYSTYALYRWYISIFGHTFPKMNIFTHQNNNFNFFREIELSARISKFPPTVYNLYNGYVSIYLCKRLV